MSRNKDLSYPEAIVFDCYKTLFENSTSDWITTFNKIINDLNLNISKENLWEKWKFHEVNFRKSRTNLEDPLKSPKFISYRTAWTDCFRITFDELHIKSNYKHAGEIAAQHMSNSPIFPETKFTINELSNKVKLGIFSNADEEGLQPLIKNSGLKFDEILSSEKAQVYKPSPSAFLKIYNSLEVEPKNAWYVGDHLFDDILGAHSVGSTAIWINRNNSKIKKNEEKPDIIISELNELCKILDQIKK